MKTVTAKELRANLDDILTRVNAGEEVIITHRFKKPVVLRNFVQEKKKVHTAGQLPPGIAAFLKAPKKKIQLDPNKSFKEIYYEDMEQKYGL